MKTSDRTPTDICTVHFCANANRRTGLPAVASGACQRHLDGELSVPPKPPQPDAHGDGQLTHQKKPTGKRVQPWKGHSLGYRTKVTLARNTCEPRRLEPKWLRRWWREEGEGEERKRGEGGKGGGRGWWWCWCRRCNNEDVSLHVPRMRATDFVGPCQYTDPFGWTDQPEAPLRLFPPKAGSRLPLNPKARKKDCEARPHPLSYVRKGGEEGGGNLFHLPRRLKALNPE